MQKKVLIVIPAFNEERNIADIVAQSLKYGIVVVVDDASRDDTAKTAEAGGAIVLRQSVNMGAGFTTLTGVEYGIQRFDPEVIVTIDGDGQHPPQFIPKLIKKMGEGYEVVFATRNLNREDMPWIKRVGNNLLSNLLNMLFRSSVSDTQTGFKAFTKSAYQRIRITSDGYEYCSQFIYEVVNKRITYTEIDIPAVYDKNLKYKGTNVFTGIDILGKSIRFMLR
jgi:glycosyltransferase involved in cell wall biosynthesis